MRITSIELVGFKRMQLNQVSSFKMTITEVVQLILGSNGSGKSSLLGELTPLPADPANYFKEGSKTIRIMHRGHEYVLKSWFSPSQKHSFERDGESLNDGGTVTVQKELVRQEFGITAEIHDLLTGKLLFCNFGPLKRREWFTRLSDTNYDYALAVFQRLKDRRRDFEGGLKVAKKRLVSEQAKIVSADEQDKLSREVQQITAELELLQAHRAPVERPSATYRPQLEEGLHELQRLSQRLLRLRVVPPGLREYPDDLEVVAEVIEGLRHDMAVSTELLNKAAADYNKLEETVLVLKRTGAEGVASLRTKRMALLQEGVQLQERCQLLKTYDAQEFPPKIAQQALQSVLSQLVEISNAIPANDDRRFSSQRLEEVQKELTAIQEKRGAAATQALQLGGKRQHMQLHRKADAVECPACRHRWHLGYSDEESLKLDERIAQLEQEIKQHDEHISITSLRVQEIREYGEQYRSFMRIAHSLPVLRPLWDYLTAEQLLVRAPMKVGSVLQTYTQDLELLVQVEHIESQLREVDQLIRDTEQLGDASLSEQQQKLDDLTLYVEDLTLRLNTARQKLADYESYRRQVMEAVVLGAQIEQLRAELTASNAQMIEMARRETIQHVIRQLNAQLVRKEETLAAVTLHKGIIADLEAQIAHLEQQEQAASLLVKELSPTEGLIAEGLMGFIRSFTAQMNNLIRKIWTYPLVIQGCGQMGEDGAELDYKFPMMVERPDNVVKDVSEGSTGQQDIVNLAFMVTAMQFLGLAEAPLYLDEFGAHFDDAHRSAAMDTIKALLDQRPFTQLFLVSHYQASYGVLTNAEICVICPNNITVPVQHKYNQHVVME